MKTALKTICLLLLSVGAIAQEISSDSLRRLFTNATDDSIRFEASRSLYSYYEETNRDSALYYAEQDLLLAIKNNKKLVEVMALDTKGYQLMHLGRYSESLQCLLQAYKIAEDPRNDREENWTLSSSPSPGKSRLLVLSITHHMLGLLMLQTQNIGEQIFHFREAGKIASEINNPFRQLLSSMNLANSYVLINKPDSALLYAREAENITMQSGRKKYLGQIFSILGEINLGYGNKTLGKQYLYQGVQSSLEQNNQSSLNRNYVRLIRYYLAEKQQDSALYYSLKNLHTVQSLGGILGLESNIGTAYENVYLSYKLGNQFDSTFKYQGLALLAKDSLSKIRIKNLAEFQNVNFREQLRLQNLENEKTAYQNKIRIYTLITAIAICILVVFLLYRNSRSRKRANDLLQKQKEALQESQVQLKNKNRELEIETSLERIRTKAMSMQKSEDLSNAVAIVFEELDKLQMGTLRCGISIINKEKQTTEIWSTLKSEKGTVVQVSGDESMKIHPLLQGAYNAWLKQEDYDYLLQGNDLNSFYEALADTNFKLPEVPGEKNAQQYMYVAHFPAGGLYAFRDLSFSDEAKMVIKRFADVFNLTYTRFNDLKQAEAQAREAQIEASLERVRSRAMAMQKSEDLADAVAVVFEELDKLKLGMLRCGIGILHREKRSADVWTTTISDNNSVVQVSGDESMEIHPLLQGAFDAWLKQKDYNYILKGDDLTNYYKALTGVNFRLPGSQSFVSGSGEMQQYYFNAIFPAGGLFAFRETAFSEEAKKVIKRFADVFNLTYTRFNDLKQAEAQTRQAQIEVALERVRARALAMQEPEELVEVAGVLRREMSLLGVQELETGTIFIYDEAASKAECWFTVKDIRRAGNKIITDNITLDLQETRVGRQIFAFFNSSQKQISISMQGNNRKEWIGYCRKLSKALDDFYVDEIPDRTYHLYKFSAGAIGAASPGDISGESWDLMQRVASVFSLAYSRFKDLTQARYDLQQLKTEKQRAEEALTELQTTQKQLIQSEKMASLGELTAGIAHEIQNPLNFVNNFSEVSNELILELKGEKSKAGNERDVQLENELLNDISLNLEKIMHHGKRADAIVKGMLQHSQSSSGVKEPTDINALTDEYLRLAYHGLRAKDKLFNAVLETDYDKDLSTGNGYINIIPHDMGRVLLNLYNNAFYAVAEKKKASGLNGFNAAEDASRYEPIVSVKTKKSGDKVEIRVADNGNGIPPKIVDKIFQPFFTTKPTGLGTGLGLSLSYDIIKAHGGELKVETKEGDGAEFIIILSV